MNNVKDIRKIFIGKYRAGDFVIDKTGAKTVEIIGATFIADEDWIIADANEDYIERELAWYESQSLFVKDIPGKTPAIWEAVSSSEGKINSNYGWCIYSEDNGSQYVNVLSELQKNPNSRRAAMIYNRPSMHTDYNTNGMSDFMCTFANNFFIRDNKLVSHVLMRSCDSRFGYNNDRAWFSYVQNKLATELNIEVGDLIWTASSLHVYERDFIHFEEYWKKFVE